MTTIYLHALFFILGLMIGVNLAVFSAYFYFKRKKDREVAEILDGFAPDFDEEEFIERDDEPVSITDDGVIKLNLMNLHERMELDAVKKLSHINTYKKAIDVRKKQYVENEEYEKAQKLDDDLDTIDVWFEQRKNWFLDRIGCKVKTNKLTCDCDACQDAMREGYEISNEVVALKMFCEELKHRLHCEEITFIEV